MSDSDLHHAPPSLANFRFSTIGKQPDLLKRISTPQQNQDYQDIPPSPSPSHSSTINQPASRPTLLQALAATDESQSDSANRTSPSHSQPRMGIFDKRATALFASQASASLRQPSMSRDEFSVKPESRLTSPDFAYSMELVYPPTESAPSRSPAPAPVESPAADLNSPSRVNLPTRIRHMISSLDAATTRQPNILNSITLLEQDLQSVAAQTSLCLENAHRAKALAQRSFVTAKESLNIAQESVFVAQSAKDRVDQVLFGLAQLAILYKDEVTGEQRRNFRHELEEFYQLATEPARDEVVTQPTGLPHEVLQAMVAEIARKIREHDHGSRKRKRGQEDHDESAEAQPFKERRIEQSIMASDWFLEMEAELVRKAWGQEAERRSTSPPDSVMDTTLDHQKKKTITETHASDADMDTSETIQAPADQVTEQPNAPSERGLSSCHSAGSATGPEEMEDTLQAQRRCELEKQKLEIARFQIRERELQELQIKHKQTEKKNAATLNDSQKKGAMDRGPTTSSTSTTNSVTSKDAPPNPMQRKSAAAEIIRKKALEQRLAMEKQQASVAVQPGQAQAGDAVQISSPPGLADQGARLSQEGIPARQSDSQSRPPKQLSGAKKDDAQRSEQQEVGAVAYAKLQAENAKLKGRTNGGSDTNRPGKPKMNTAPNVGNVVAQQTLVMSPATKLKGKKPRTAQTPVAATGQSSTQNSMPPRQDFGLPSRPPFQPVRPVMTQETAARNIRLPSVPPIECIIEPTDRDMGRMKTPVVTRRVSPTESATSVSMSAGTQSANLRFVQSAIPITTEHNASGQTAQRPLRVSTDTVVPKVEIQSPLVTQSVTVSHSLPQSPPNPNGNIPDASQSRAIRRPTPTGDPQTPYDDRCRQSNEIAGCGAPDTTNRGSNISSGSMDPKKSVPSTSPLTDPPAPYLHNLSPRDELSMDAARIFQQVNHETQRTFHQNDLPSASSYGAGPSNTSYRRENVSMSPPRFIGANRPREVDDVGRRRRWSPDRLRREARPERRQNHRTPPYSPPPRFPEDRPLLDRLEPTHESRVYRHKNGGEPYRPISAFDIADQDMQKYWDDVDGYPLDPRPNLIDRFTDGRQGRSRQNGSALRGKRGRRGSTSLEQPVTALSLEQRLS